MWTACACCGKIRAFRFLRAGLEIMFFSYWRWHFENSVHNLSAFVFFEEVSFPRHHVGFNLLVSFFAGTDEWKAWKFYQNAALKVEGRRLWISLTFGVLLKPTNLWIESAIERCVRTTMNQGTPEPCPDFTGTLNPRLDQGEPKGKSQNL